MLQIQSGKATGASFHFGGIAGRAPRPIAGDRQMLEIHDDASIADGTLVQLEPEPACEGLLEGADLSV